MLKKIINYAVILPFFTLFLYLPNAQADLAGMNLFNHVGTEIENLEGNKDYEKEKVLIKVGEYQKATTVDRLLTTAREVLSAPQYKIFVLPLALTYLQKMPMAVVTVNGNHMTEIQFGSAVPPTLSGLGSVVIEYKGETTLVRQVIANLKAEEKAKSPTQKSEK